MKGQFLVPAALLLLLSCTHLPTIAPLTAKPLSDPAAECHRIFPDGNWQFLHTVKAELPGGNILVAMGLTVISSRLRTARSIIMTLEGLVVFDGEYDQQLTVHRAFAPFDSPEFAEGLMDDIQLIFFKPEGPVVAFGESAEGSIVCRHENPDGRFVDIVLNPDNTWELRRYSRERRLTRTVKAQADKWNNTDFPETIELTARDNRNYKLGMTLVEAIAASH